MDQAVLVPLEQRTDEELAARVATHDDRAALGELVSRYGPRLRRLLHSLIGPDPELIADAEQEVYATLIRRIDRFHSPTDVWTDVLGELALPDD